jgi:endo-1,4-beta-xylanase
MKTMIKIALVPLAFIFFNAATCQNAADNVSTNEIVPLKTIYQDYFLIGNIINPRYMLDEYFEVLTTHYNTVTCENDMKPDRLAPREKGASYRWTTADSMVSKMAEYNIKVHGHTLVWHSQTPAWMTTGTPAEVRENMVSYIKAVLGHYKGKVFSWDVVNEALREGVNDSNWRNNLRTDSGWYIAMGADYIELAFRTAREADPDVLLYYNDYNLNNQRKSDAVRNLVKELNDKYKAEGNTRNLIDGIGMQAHYSVNTRIGDVSASIGKFAEIGVIVDISELDLETKTSGGSSRTGRNSVMTDTEARLQAIQYALLFKVFMEYKDHITRVTMWGIDDENSWRSFGNPCLFDEDLKPKPAFFAVSYASSYLPEE